MTTEHKILALIDRGVSDEDTIAALLDTEAIAPVLARAFYAALVLNYNDHLSLTERGLARLNELDAEAA